MKKISVLVVVMLVISTNLWAAKVFDVTNSRHNLGTTSPSVIPNNNIYPSVAGLGAEDEVCIFCHTPHGGTLNTPLWNRALPDQSAGNEFTHYTSASLSPYMKGLSATRPVSDESLLCMSCHDGSVAMNEIVNISNRTGEQPNNAMFITGVGGAGAVIGSYTEGWAAAAGEYRTLSDDHPISFSYSSAYDDTQNLNKLRTVTVAEAAGARFFGATKRVECSSCHDPHVNYYAALGGDPAYNPFLTTPNDGSKLCLACHIK